MIVRPKNEMMGERIRIKIRKKSDFRHDLKVPRRNNTRSHLAFVLHQVILYLIIWLTDFACCDWSIPDP